MTSESDNKAGRRPPTIELTATEVGNSQSPAAAGPEPAGEPAAVEDALNENRTRSESETRSENESSGATAAPSQAEQSDAPEPNSPDADATQAQPARSGRQLTSHAASALLGAVAAAAIIGGAWLAGFIPSRNAPTPAEPLAAPSASTNSATDAAIAARLDKIEHAIQGQQQPDAAMGSRIAAVEAQTKSLSTGIAALGGRLDEIASAGQIAVKQADAANAAAEAATKASQATNQTMSQNTAQRGDIEALTNRVVTLENTVKALTAAATESAPQPDDRPARLSVAAEALRATVERGAPYQAELAAVAALGVDRAAIAPLQPFARQGVPSVGALARELMALTAAMEGIVQPTATDATFLDRLKANAQKLVRITPAGAPPGNDPADVIARIKFNAAHGDIDAAPADIKQLPDPAKALAADWIKKAQSRDAAIAASRQIATDALAALSKPSDQ
jgi:hypothetical protein